MVRFHQVTKMYKDNQSTVFCHLSFHLKRGGFLFITGESGTGKSTIIKLLLKEIEPDDGEIWVNGMNIQKIRGRKIAGYRREIGVVFQQFKLIKDKSVYENIALALIVAGKTGSGIVRRVSAILSLLNLSGKFKAYPTELSGGEQQKVCLARALVNEPLILLADEPTGNLDADSAAEIMKLLEWLNQRGMTIIMVTHNQSIIREYGYPVLALQENYCMPVNWADGSQR